MNRLQGKARWREVEGGGGGEQGHILTKNRLFVSAVQFVRIMVIYVCSLVCCFIYAGGHASRGPRGEKGPLKQADS